MYVSIKACHDCEKIMNNLWPFNLLMFQFMHLVISLFGFEGRMWDLIVSVPDHCLSFYFAIFHLQTAM